MQRGGRGAEGHLEEIRVRPDKPALVKRDSGLSGGLLSHRLSARPSFICPSPNKTRTALSDSHTAAGANRPGLVSPPCVWAHAENNRPADDDVTGFSSDGQTHHCVRMQFVRSANLFISSRLVKAKEPGQRGNPEHAGM